MTRAYELSTSLSLKPIRKVPSFRPLTDRTISVSTRWFQAVLLLSSLAPFRSSIETRASSFVSPFDSRFKKSRPGRVKPSPTRWSKYERSIKFLYEKFSHVREIEPDFDEEKHVRTFEDTESGVYHTLSSNRRRLLCSVCECMHVWMYVSCDQVLVCVYVYV